MENYITPTKENIHSKTRQRQGDWVCFNCNNLNFSFRKKCNRCKIQTKQHNHLTPIYSYYYYLQPTSQSHQHPRQPLLNSNLHNIQQHLSSPQHIKPQLPSVSPLVKKYNNSKMKEKATASTNKNSMIDLNQENIWECLNFIESDKLQEKNKDDDLESNEQLQKIIGRIIL